jgi:predicted porin
MGSNDTLLVSNLIEDTEYEITYKYDIYDTLTSVTYSTITDPVKVKTTNFDLPTITTFEIAKQTDTYINIDYQYKDSDKVVTAAYLYVNGVSDRVLSTKVGTEKVTIDLDASAYDIELVIEYSDGTSTKQIKSDTIHLNKNEQQKVEEPTTSDTGSTKKKCGKKSASMLISLLSSVSILYIILKRKH